VFNEVPQALLAPSEEVTAGPPRLRSSVGNAQQTPSYPCCNGVFLPTLGCACSVQPQAPTTLFPTPIGGISMGATVR
jgi:hypothetical protein